MKITKENQNQSRTDADDNGVGERCSVFRHLKIHTVPACKKGQRQKNRSDDGKDFHNIVLLDINLGLVSFPDCFNVFLQMEHKFKKTVEFPVDESKGWIGRKEAHQREIPSARNSV